MFSFRRIFIQFSLLLLVSAVGLAGNWWIHQRFRASAISAAATSTDSKVLGIIQDNEEYTFIDLAKEVLDLFIHPGQVFTSGGIQGN